MVKKPPDPPNDDPEEEDNQKPIIHLGGDEVRPDHNLSLWTAIAHEKWKWVPETIRGIQLSAYSHGYDVSSDTAFHHAQAEEEEERRHQPLIVRFDSESEEGHEEDDDDDADDEPLQPIECNFKGKMFCKTCFLFKKPESVWWSHHTGQMLACPTIPTDVKRELVEKYKYADA